MIPKLQHYLTKWAIQSDHSIKPGLDAIKHALEKVGNPEKNIRAIHVAGTNGKGSTIAFMEAILREHQFSMGVFSSPALIDIHDQIRLNGKPIPEEELDSTFQTIRRAGLSGQLTDFELLTVAAFITFDRIGPDYVLLETGMGGLLDSTNVVQPIASVVTSVALDHTTFLGGTLSEIATQKAGIIKEGVPVICGPLQGETLQIMRKAADINNSQLFLYNDQFTMKQSLKGEQFNGMRKFRLPERKMKGPHQAINAAVAIETLQVAGIDLQEQAVATAIRTAQLAFRFQQIAADVYMDGAHNPAAAKMLAHTIRTEFPGEKVDFIIGMIKGKDIEGTLQELIPVAASFTFVSFPHPEAISAHELLNHCEHDDKTTTTSVEETLLQLSDNGCKKVVAGSLYLIASLMD
ncbi:folylpolyglutamate synthase/dihydrofolate synthase family protein [Sporosarcina sp. HYO08]|uniref:bifunctional folylpolyglutamate synthase/dihydrofolate synthase n=1 Tax=Sporosarcina sp. HYO08 TaxID=1759557 RepID=UPI000792AA08|nr:folylpolyglutamate synthase/dihydrofolate synthase family protein [Sporosarcina sp. HYO08]KXH87308.1 hypothetical protein AU377_01670 [Sporosarcina sp. HYO08]